MDKRISRKKKAEIDKEFENIFNYKNIEKAGKLCRKLSVLSNEDLLKSYTYLNEKKASKLKIVNTLESIPFHKQDTAVESCVTNACGIVPHPLNNRFGEQKFSPFEERNLPVSSSRLEEHNFPNSTGLTLLQMKSSFDTLGLETEIIHLEKIEKNFKNFSPTKDDIAADAVKAYDNLKLPIIAIIRLEKNKGQKSEEMDDSHAAVICSYRQNDEGLKEFYIHDYKMPYSLTLPDGKFYKLKNEWKQQGYNEIYIEKLIVSIYPKIRFSFYVIYSLFLDCKRNLESHDEPKSSELFLTELNQYKEYLWKKSFKDEKNILCKLLTQYMWIIRTYTNGNPDSDYVFDGTSVNSSPICRILFENMKTLHKLKEVKNEEVISGNDRLSLFGNVKRIKKKN